MEPRFGEVPWRIAASGRRFSYLACNECQLLVCDPTPTDAELGEYYASNFDYGWYERHIRLKQWQAGRRWRQVSRYLEQALGGRGALLDVGCGHGLFTRVAQRGGWQTTGLDMPGAPLDYARQQGLRVVAGTIESAELPAASFDVITLWHSFEHMREPDLVLHKLKHWLKPGGVLLIAVPNLHAAGLDRCGAKWVWLQQPFVHIWHWSARSLTKLLARNEFRVTYTITHDTWDAQYWYDAVFNPRFERRYARKLSHGSVRAARRFGFHEPEHTGEQVYFVLTETARLLCYGMESVSGPLTPQHGDRGSELLVMAVPNAAHAE